jgi:Holliday junction resolvasome RuvABC DNA-binding subunit
MMANLHLKKTLLQVVDNQLNENNPPATKETYDRLQDLGYTKQQAKEKIAAVVLTEIYDILKDGAQFEEASYIAALEDLG